MHNFGNDCCIIIDNFLKNHANVSDRNANQNTIFSTSTMIYYIFAADHSRLKVSHLVVGVWDNSNKANNANDWIFSKSLMFHDILMETSLLLRLTNVLLIKNDALFKISSCRILTILWLHSDKSYMKRRQTKVLSRIIKQCHA